VSHWPPLPYKGLAFYGPEDLPLFAGRDADIEACAGLLAAPNTRTLLLHGRTGCGKSSFLRAGLIPTIESRGHGFEFLRGTADGVRTPIFIRSTGAPLDRLAEEIFRFVSSKHVTRTAIGNVDIDLSAAALGCNTVGEFIGAADSPSRLIDSLRKISEKLPNSLIIILDQAEEVITLTQPADPDRNNFFRFLKLINAFYLDVKLIIALRTEYFGMFFDLMGLDGSIKTDINQFRLEELDEGDVREAILRPTSKTKVIDGKSAFDVYQFQYTPELIDIILKDLFSATQSGGMLPAMQVLCRDLYNEVQKQQKPWVIDTSLYMGGGRLTGRVDRHISASLRDAIAQSIIDPRVRIDVDAEERRWRKALCSLVKLESDGTAKTDLVDRGTILTPFGDRREPYDYKGVLTYISKPEILIVRDFSVFNPRTGVNETKYSLGHDAVALALYHWEVEEKQAEEKRLALAAARRRFLTLAGGLLLVTAAAASAAYSSVRSKLDLAQALMSAADRVYATKPNVAIASATQADDVLSNPFVSLLDRTGNSNAKRLANMISSLPSKTLPPELIGQSEVQILPSVKGFLLCCADNRMKVIDGESFSVRFDYPLTGIEESLRMTSAEYIDDAGTYLLGLDRTSSSKPSSEENSTSRPDETSVIVVTDGNVSRVVDKKVFMENSKSFTNKDISDVNVTVWRGLVVLWIYLRNQGRADSELFALSHDWKEVKGPFLFENVRTGNAEAIMPSVVAGEYWVEIEKNAGDARLNVTKLRGKSEERLRESGNDRFSGAVLRSHTAHCYRKTDIKYDCKARALVRGPYFLIESRLNEPETGKGGVGSMEEKEPTEITIVNVNTGEYFDVLSTGLKSSEVFKTDAPVAIEEVTVDNDGIFLIMSVPNGSARNVFFAKKPDDMEKKLISPEYVGSVQVPDGEGARYAHIVNTKTIMGELSVRGRQSGALWELGDAFFERRESLGSLSRAKLIESVCKAGLAAVDDSIWKKEIGIGSPPEYRCPPEDTPGATSSRQNRGEKR